MKVLTAGGGSGGHVTPVKAVIEELSHHAESLEVRFVCDAKFAPQARQLMAELPFDVPVTTILTGKLRRYHGIPLWRQLLDLPSVAKNIRDGFLVGIGAVQSIVLLMRWRPDVVFTKGGFVCLPIGWAAHILKIPLVIHDSDAHPGLTNRVLARWAVAIATGSPIENYPYRRSIMTYVGIPVDPSLRPPAPEAQRAFKDKIGLVDTSRPLVVVTGGGLGARRINSAIVAVATELIEAGYSIYHVAGPANAHGIEDKIPDSVHYQLVAFSADMPSVLSAADVIVTRAGATALQEAAALAKPTIIIPNPILSGGHQTKNAQVYDDAGAAIVISEKELGADPGVLSKAILSRLASSRDRLSFAKAIYRFARPDATLDVVNLIVGASLTHERAKKLRHTRGNR